MADVLRPVRARLAQALDVAETVAPPCVTCRGTGAQQERQTCLACDGRGWSLADAACAAELWEALATRGVIPLDAAEDARRGFAPQVIAVGRRRTPPLDGDAWEPVVTYETRPGMTGTTVVSDAGWGFALPHPPTIAACVALASDWAGVLTAEALAREIVAACEIPRFRGAGRIVWRVGTPLHPRYRSGWPRHDAIMRELEALGYALDAVTDTAVVLVAPALEDGAPACAERSTTP